ncbi:MAG: hypothetical protein GY719_37535 [bacterium]|nr:hypothetical protein [bacterium]
MARFRLRAAISILCFSAFCATARGQVVLEKETERGVALEPIDWLALTAQLPELGPRLVGGREGAVEARGFLAAGWPVVVDFELKQKGELILRIWTEEKSEQIYFQGRKNRRRVEKTQVPGRLGRRLKAGRFVVQAYDKKGAPIDFELYGIGVGKRAVGSLVIEQLRFGPESIRPAASEEAAYSFFLRRDFEETQAEILRQRYLPEERVFENTVVHVNEVDCRRKTTCEDRWGGMTDDGSPSQGSHLLQVRAWFRTPVAKQDWTIVRSEDRVAIDPE